MAKAFMDDHADIVDRSLSGLAKTYPDIVELRTDPLFVLARERCPGRRVGLVSGGGSGHEPMHVGLVGHGMLDAAVPGRVFASPHNRQIYQASLAAAGDAGVLHIVKNYTGDRINFGIAAERLKADGIAVARVLVDDDLATDDPEARTGRRGTAATIVVEKVLGAAADEGLDLEQLQTAGMRVAAHSRSVAVAATAQTKLSTGTPAFEIPDGRLEYGVGIHGERAREVVARPDFESLIGRMVSQVDDACPAGQQVLAIVNGLGATTQLELHGIFDAVTDRLAERGREVMGSLVGSYSPALDMHGFSITLTVIAEPDWLRWWRAPAWTAALRTLGVSSC
jgi:dihydroxyacetone kinase-like protein